jgi:hypothetical protein
VLSFWSKPVKPPFFPRKNFQKKMLKEAEVEIAADYFAENLKCGRCTLK